MKHSIVLLLVALAPLAVLAQVDPDANSCGIYFDADATQNCFFTTTPFQQITAYICVTNLTDHSGISGWECGVEITGDGLVAASWFYLWDATIFLDPPDLVAGVWPPAPWSPSIPLARLTGFVEDPGDSVDFRIVASSTPSMPGHNGMVVAGGNNALVIYPIYNSTGYGSDGVPNICAAVNNAGPCPVPTENTTWGGVKAMFE